MSLLHTFAGSLRKYRAERGLSQEEFVDIAGLHRTDISAIELEKRSIALDNVEKNAVALELMHFYYLLITIMIRRSRKK